MNKKLFGPEIGTAISNIYHWTIGIDGKTLQPIPPKAELPQFVVERIQYFYQYMEEGLSFQKCLSLILANQPIEHIICEFDESFGEYIEPSQEFIQWRDDKHLISFHEMEIAVAILYGTTNENYKRELWE